MTARPPKFSWNGFYSAYRASKPTVYCVAWRVVWRLYSFNLPERRVAEPEPERSPGTGAEACPQSRSRSNFPGSAALISHIWKPTNSVDVFYDILIDKAFSGLLSDDGPLGSGAPRRSGPLPPWWNPGYATAHRKGYWCLLCSWWLIMLVKGYLGSRQTILLSLEPYDNVIQRSKIHLKTVYQKYIRTYDAPCI